MKTRVNLSIEADVLRDAKIFAEDHETSLSELTEDYLKNIIRKKKNKSILDLIKELPKPNIPADADLKKLYYDDSKHGR